MFRSYQIKIDGREDLIDPIEATKPKKAKKEVFSDNVRINPSDALVFLGFCHEMHVKQGQNIPFMEGKFPIFTTAEGDKLYIIPQKRVTPVTNAVDDKKAIEMFEEWSHYKADVKDFKIDFPDAEPVSAGKAHKILYESDKVMQPGDGKGKTNYYKHNFDKNKRPVSVIDDIMVVDNIAINGRGILN